MNTGRFVLRSDISEWYASTYTHSIEWALDGKLAAKARLGKRGAPKTLGVLLDAAARGTQDGQTKGIPIGPDTSILLSEVVLCAVDHELQAAVAGIASRGLRFMDDWEYFASSVTEAEDVLLRWQSALADYELMINPSKTSIVEGAQPLDAPWRTALTQFSLRDGSDRVRANDLMGFFSLAFDLTKTYPTESVLSYAIGRVRNQKLGTMSTEVVADLMLAAVMADPSCIANVARWLHARAVLGSPVSKRRVAETMNELCRYHARREHGSEVTWALWILRHFSLHLDSEAASAVAGMHDNCSVLLLLDLIQRGFVDGVLPDTAPIRARAESSQAWRTEDWLLAYECARNGWSSSAAFKGQKAWLELLKLDVAFFRAGSAAEVAAPQEATGGQIVAPEPPVGVSGGGSGPSSEPTDDLPAPEGDGGTQRTRKPAAPARPQPRYSPVVIDDSVAATPDGGPSEDEPDPVRATIVRIPPGAPTEPEPLVAIDDLTDVPVDLGQEPY